MIRKIGLTFISFFIGCSLVVAATLKKPNMLDKTKDALMSYDVVEERTDYLVFKLKRLTFGDYSDHLLYLSPFFTGNVEFQAMDMKFYYNYNKRKAGVKYSFNF